VLKVFLVIVVSMIIVDVSLLAGLGICEALDRHRQRRQIKDLETLWRLEPGGSVRPLRPRPASPTRARRLAGIALAAVTLCAGTAFASPTARDAATSVLGSVARGLRLAPSEDAGVEVAQPPAESDAAPPAARRPTPTSNTSNTPSPHVDADPDEPSPATSGGNPPADTTRPERPPPEVAVPPPEAIPVPDSPATLTAAAVSSSEIYVNWVGVDGALRYRLQRLNDGGVAWDTIAVTGPEVTSYIDAGRAPGTTFHYRVIATNEGGDSAPSDVTSATTLVAPPSAPLVTAAPASPSEIHLGWADVIGETGYRVERSSDAAGWVTIATTGQDETTFIDTGLAPDTSYYYRVFATNVAGDSPPSDLAMATTPSALEASAEPA
jgi:hypothetical protein